METHPIGQAEFLDACRQGVGVRSVAKHQQSDRRVGPHHGVEDRVEALGGDDPAGIADGEAACPELGARRVAVAGMEDGAIDAVLDNARRAAIAAGLRYGQSLGMAHAQRVDVVQGVAADLLEGR